MLSGRRRTVTRTSSTRKHATQHVVANQEVMPQCGEDMEAGQPKENVTQYFVDLLESTIAFALGIRAPSYCPTRRDCRG